MPVLTGINCWRELPCLEGKGDAEISLLADPAPFLPSQALQEKKKKPSWFCIFQPRRAEQSELCWGVMENPDLGICYCLRGIPGQWKLNTSA